MAVSFGVQNGLIAPRTSPGTYGAGVDARHINMIGATLRVRSAEGFGNNKLAVLASQVIAGTVQIKLLGATLDILSIILGIDVDTEGSDPNVTRTIQIPGGIRLPHFGIVGQGLAEESLGDQLIFAPNLVVASDIVLLNMTDAALNNLEFTATALDDDDFGIFDIIERDTIATIVLPPANLV